jgi:hypothetical protein
VLRFPKPIQSLENINGISWLMHLSARTCQTSLHLELYNEYLVLPSVNRTHTTSMIVLYYNLSGEIYFLHLLLVAVRYIYTRILFW